MRLFYHGSASLREGRSGLPGHSYYVTTRILPDRGYLTPEARGIVLESLRFTHGERWWQLLGFVVMPDHLHLAAKLGDIKGLSDIVASLKKWSARRVNALSSLHGNLWQEGYRETEIRGDARLRRVLEYTVNNPVKAGLARRPGEYRWCWVPGWYPAEALEQNPTGMGSGSGEPSH